MRSNPYHRFEVNGNVQTKNGGTVNLITVKKPLKDCDADSKKIYRRPNQMGRQQF